MAAYQSINFSFKSIGKLYSTKYVYNELKEIAA